MHDVHVVLETEHSKQGLTHCMHILVISEGKYPEGQVVTQALNQYSSHISLPIIKY